MMIFVSKQAQLADSQPARSGEGVGKLLWMYHLWITIFVIREYLLVTPLNVSPKWTGVIIKQPASQSVSHSVRHVQKYLDILLAKGVNILIYHPLLCCSK